tara:strand:+ start:300 stop:461 length:162 start_codon:yes stop_codon:yes gene_type:complete
MITLDSLDFTSEGWARLTKEIIRDNEFNGTLNVTGNMIESIQLFDIGEIVINE